MAEESESSAILTVVLDGGRVLHWGSFRIYAECLENESGSVALVIDRIDSSSELALEHATSVWLVSRCLGRVESVRLVTSLVDPKILSQDGPTSDGSSEHGKNI